jgi:DNA-binding PadR family transcriptional regulator
VDHSVGYFWPFPHAQLYSEPKRLAQAGLLGLTTEEQGRRRQTFTITPAGRRALKAWLADPTGEPMQIRDIAELKLFFAEVADSEDVLALAREQVEQHKERLATYKAMQERFGGQPEFAKRLLSLGLGIEMERAALAYWRRLAASSPLEESPSAGRPRSRGRTP